VIGVYAALRAEPRARRALGVCATIALGGLALLLFAAAIGNDYILTRNLIGFWPVVAVALAVALASLRGRSLGTGTAVALCLLGAGLAIWNATTTAAQRPSYSQVAEALGPTAGPRLIISQSSFSSPLVLYLDGARVASEEDLRTRELVVIEPRPTDDYAVGTCLWLPTCGGEDVEPPPRFEPPPGFEAVRTATTESFAYTVYEAPRPVAIERPVEYFTPRVFVQEPA
jgi:hypothetical protein